MVTLSGEEKGALLLSNLAPEIVDQVLAQLGPERRARLRVLMNQLPSRPENQEMLEGLLQELNSALTDKKPRLADTAPPAVRLATPPAGNTPPPAERGAVPAPPAAATAPTTASSPDASIRSYAAQANRPTSAPDVADPLAALAQLPAERIARVLADETARTNSLILNALEVGLAGEVFKRLAPTVRNEVSVQFSMQANPSMEVLQRIAQALLRKNERLADILQFPDAAARNRKMANMLRLLGKPDRLQVLEALAVKDPETAAKIKDLLYCFDDVLRIDNRSMQKILMDIDTKNLALALKGATDGIRDKFLQNLSKRAQENLQEEQEMLQTAPKDQIEQAQNAIVAVIQRLDLAGELVMAD